MPVRGLADDLSSYLDRGIDRVDDLLLCWRDRNRII
jgi:hypothetical protein